MIHRSPPTPRPRSEITHTDTVAYAVAISTADPETAATRADVAATGATEMVSVGLDVEHRRQIDAELVSTIMTLREHARWAALDGEAADRFATMVFTAKEALYKALHPLLDQTIAWHSVLVRPRPRSTLQKLVVLAPAAPAA